MLVAGNCDFLDHDLSTQVLGDDEQRIKLVHSVSTLKYEKYRTQICTSYSS